MNCFASFVSRWNLFVKKKHSYNVKITSNIYYTDQQLWEMEYSDKHTVVHPFSNKLNVVRVPDVTNLNIPDAKYAPYDPEKKTDSFSNLKREFEEHVRKTPEKTFQFSVPTSDAGLDESNKITPFMQYADKLCTEARKKHWKCDVASFGDTVKIMLDK